MHVTVGDRIVIRNHRLGEPDRSGIVLNVEGDHGALSHALGRRP